MRARPDIGSPWLPVVAMTSLLSGTSPILSLPTIWLAGYCRYPRSLAIRKFCSIERPITATCRSNATAASRTCWIRAMLLANVATMTRPTPGQVIARLTTRTIIGTPFIKRRGLPGNLTDCIRAGMTAATFMQTCANASLKVQSSA